MLHMNGPSRDTSAEANAAISRELRHVLDLCCRACLLQEYWLNEERSTVGLRTREEVREMDQALAIVYLTLLIRSHRRERVC